MRTSAPVTSVATPAVYDSACSMLLGAWFLICSCVTMEIARGVSRSALPSLLLALRSSAT
ncbi:hypothetical protein D3C80_2182540 [compost metagenome]